MARVDSDRSVVAITAALALLDINKKDQDVNMTCTGSIEGDVDMLDHASNTSGRVDILAIDHADVQMAPAKSVTAKSQGQTIVSSKGHTINC